MFTVSVNPTTLCNFSCDFCYLSSEQLQDKNRIDLSVLDKRLEEVSNHHKIYTVDLYGGEVSLLPIKYAEKMVDIIDKYTDNINVITNMSRSINKTPWLLRKNITLSVSWDYTCRERWDEVLRNIIETPKQIHILMLVSECVINWSIHMIDEVSNILNNVGNIVSMELKPYSVNQNNCLPVTHDKFEQFVKKWIIHNPAKSRQYEFVNINNIENSLSKQKSSWSDDHVYILPSGKFAVLDFDEHNKEHFTELNTYEEYIEWTIKEKNKSSNNTICNNCPYYGHCLSEHLQNVNSLQHSCNGFRNLLNWYENERTLY